MSTAVISMLLPTRGRPALVKRLFETIAHRTRQLDRIELVLYVDEDDTASHGLTHTHFSVKRIVGPRTTMGAYNTACWREAQGAIAVLVNDDMVIRTDGWDDIVRELDERFSDRIYLGYGNDLFKGRRLCSFPILSRRTCEILAQPFPETYRGAFIDYHLLDIFKRLERCGHQRICYLPHLVFEHLHHRLGKAEFDETYRQRNRFADDAVFLGLRAMRSDAAKRLQAVIDSRGDLIDAPVTATAGEPGSLIAAAVGYWRTIACDSELPFRWRGFLYVWFVGRYLASRGYLRMGLAQR